MSTDKDKWNAIYADTNTDTPTPCHVLKQYTHLLPNNGKALDIACGRGGNAIYLASLNFESNAWDISNKVIEDLNNNYPKINAVCFDITNDTLPLTRFDIVTVSHFLDPMLFEVLPQLLNKNGLVFYETFIKDKVDEFGPKNSSYRLDKNELLRYFIDYQILAYHEEGSIGDTSKGYRNKACIVAKKT